MASHPSSDFYWADWENDPLLKAASLAAQGLWMRICCRCHHAPHRGYLLNEDGSQFTLEELAGQVGKPPAEIEPLLEELKARKVCDVDPKTGAIFNRRMVIKEPAKKARAYTNGKKGGNPDLLLKHELNTIELRKAIQRDKAAERQRRRRAAKRAAGVTQSVTGKERDSHASHAPVTVTQSVTCGAQVAEAAKENRNVTGLTSRISPSFLLPPAFESSETPSPTTARAALPPNGGGARVPGSDTDAELARLERAAARKERERREARP